jgi:hypothetical protein
MFESGAAVLEAPSRKTESEGDRDLRRRVVHFLHDANMPGLRQLSVAAHEGVVTISGRVRTYY